MFKYLIDGESYEYVDESAVDADDNADGDFFNNNYYDYVTDINKHNNINNENENDDNDEYYGDDDDDDDQDDEYEEDAGNKNKMPIDFNQQGKQHNNEQSLKPSATGSRPLSTLQIVFITILSMFLFGILVGVFIVFRMNKREESKSVRTSEESDDDDCQEDDDEDDDDDNNDLVGKTRKLKGGSFFKPIRNKIEKQKKMLAYSIFNSNHQSNSGLSTLISTENEHFNTNNKNKSLLVQFDRKNSITSSLTDYDDTKNKIYKSDENSNKKNSETSIDTKIKTNYNIYN